MHNEVNDEKKLTQWQTIFISNLQQALKHFRCLITRKRSKTFIVLDKAFLMDRDSKLVIAFLCDIELVEPADIAEHREA